MPYGTNHEPADSQCSEASPSAHLDPAELEPPNATDDAQRAAELFVHHEDAAQRMALRFSAQTGLDKEDAVSTAYVGLLQVIKNCDGPDGWDPAVGPFWPYASTYVRGELLRALHQASTSGAMLPYHDWVKLPTIRTARDDFEREMRRTPDDEELASYIYETAKVKISTGLIRQERSGHVLMPDIDDEDHMLFDDDTAIERDVDALRTRLTTVLGDSLTGIELFTVLNMTGFNGEDPVSIRATATDLCAGRGSVYGTWKRAKTKLADAGLATSQIAERPDEEDDQ